MARTRWARINQVISEGHESRDVARDSFALLFGSRLQKKLTRDDQIALSELTALSTCDSLIFFEQNLLQIDRSFFLNRPKEEYAPLFRVERDELEHIQAYRLYAMSSRFCSSYFRSADSCKTLIPGQLGRSRARWAAALLYWQAKYFSKFSYLYILASELLSIEISRCLLRDYGNGSSDPWVILNIEHMKDEVGHIRICLTHAERIYRDLSAFGRIAFWFFTFVGLGLSALVGLGGSLAIVANLPSKPKISFLRLRTFAALYHASTRANSPGRLAMRAMVSFCESSFKDFTSRVALVFFRMAS